TNGTFCNGDRITEKTLEDGDKVVVGTATVLKFNFKDDLEMNFHEVMFKSAVRDWLTNCYNKRYFEEHLAVEVKSAARHAMPLSLLMFDLDHFKRVNDTYGHRAGDFVLREVCHHIHRTLRQEELMARFGGEEFVVLARGTDQGGALVLGERCRQCIEEARFEFDGDVIPVTVSVGISTFVRDEFGTPLALMQAADKALYQAKREGRNRVVVCEGGQGPGGDR
ncbi:diguanylate cyclase, partial [Myxococcota bacterium]